MSWVIKNFKTWSQPIFPQNSRLTYMPTVSISFWVSERHFRVTILKIKVGSFSWILLLPQSSYLLIYSYRTVCSVPRSRHIHFSSPFSHFPSHTGVNPVLSPSRHIWDQKASFSLLLLPSGSWPLGPFALTLQSLHIHFPIPPLSSSVCLNSVAGMALWKHAGACQSSADGKAITVLVNNVHNLARNSQTFPPSR